MAPIALALLACGTPASPEPKPDFKPPIPPEVLEPKPKEPLARVVVHQGEVERNAWVHVPSGGGKGKPVVVVLAGGKMGEGRRMVPLFEDWFDHGVVLVFPNAKNSGDDEEAVWEGVGGPGDGSMADVDFLKTLADQVVRDNEADRERVFVTGYASGGFETWQLACFASDVFKGFAVVANGLPHGLEGCGAAGFPHPLMVVGGTDDGRAPFDGDTKMLPVMNSIETFAKKNGCDLKSAKEELLDDVSLDDGARVTRHTWTCTGAPIQVLEVAGGGHAWPRKDGKERGLDKTCRDIETADEVMAFFSITR